MVVRNLLLLIAAAVAVPAQKSFDVATIKPVAASDHRVAIRMLPGGGFSADGISLQMLITIAYDVRDFQISGGPQWMKTDRYVVNAKAEGLGERVDPAVNREMLRTLLEDRFQLKLHRETKEMPVYALVAGKGEHKMKPSDTAGGEQRRGFRMGRGQATLQGATMPALAGILAQNLGRPVTDKTGITGAFDIELHWTPEPGQGGGPFGGAPPPPGAFTTTSDTSGPSIFTAVQEQLGLKLESEKGPVETLVIDSASKPTEN